MEIRQHPPRRPLPNLTRVKSGKKERWLEETLEVLAFHLGSLALPPKSEYQRTV